MEICEEKAVLIGIKANKKRGNQNVFGINQNN